MTIEQRVARLEKKVADLKLFRLAAQAWNANGSIQNQQRVEEILKRMKK